MHICLTVSSAILLSIAYLSKFLRHNKRRPGSMRAFHSKIQGNSISNIPKSLCCMKYDNKTLWPQYWCNTGLLSKIAGQMHKCLQSFHNPVVQQNSKEKGITFKSFKSWLLNMPGNTYCFLNLISFVKQDYKNPVLEKIEQFHWLNPEHKPQILSECLLPDKQKIAETSFWIRIN